MSHWTAARTVAVLFCCALLFTGSFNTEDLLLHGAAVLSGSFDAVFVIHV
jgi:hypothetical protein